MKKQHVSLQIYPQVSKSEQRRGVLQICILTIIAQKNKKVYKPTMIRLV